MHHHFEADSKVLRIAHFLDDKYDCGPVIQTEADEVAFAVQRDIYRLYTEELVKGKFWARGYKGVLKWR
jgi:hypothetical protein